MQITWQHTNKQKPISGNQLLELRDNIQIVYDKVCGSHYNPNFSADYTTAYSGHNQQFCDSALTNNRGSHYNGADASHNYYVYSYYYNTNLSDHLSNNKGSNNQQFGQCSQHNHSQYATENQSNLQTYKSGDNYTYQQCNQDKGSYHITNNGDHNYTVYSSNNQPYGDCPQHKNTNNGDHRGSHNSSQNNSNLGTEKTSQHYSALDSKNTGVCTGQNSTVNSTNKSQYLGSDNPYNYSSNCSGHYSEYLGSNFGNDYSQNYTAYDSNKFPCPPVIQ